MSCRPLITPSESGFSRQLRRPKAYIHDPAVMSVGRGPLPGVVQNDDFSIGILTCENNRCGRNCYNRSFAKLALNLAIRLQLWRPLQPPPWRPALRKACRHPSWGRHTFRQSSWPRRRSSHSLPWRNWSEVRMLPQRFWRPIAFERAQRPLQTTSWNTRQLQSRLPGDLLSKRSSSSLLPQWLLCSSCSHRRSWTGCLLGGGLIHKRELMCVAQNVKPSVRRNKNASDAARMK